MPKGVYKHIIGKRLNTGRTHFKKGFNPWNKGKKLGKNPKHSEMMKGKKYHLGFKCSKEARKKMSEIRKKNPNRYWLNKKRPEISGENHYNWRGGKSFNPYTINWTETLKRSIRERDRYICQLCGKEQGDKAFSIHHIDYNKKNCNPDNLITLCRGCHTKTNWKRDYWKKLFLNKLNDYLSD